MVTAEVVIATGGIACPCLVTGEYVIVAGVISIPGRVAEEGIEGTGGIAESGVGTYGGHIARGVIIKRKATQGYVAISGCIFKTCIISYSNVI